MKTRIILFNVLITLFLPIFSLAQKYHITHQLKYELERAKINQEIAVNIVPEHTQILILLKARISTGMVELELYGPNGRKQRSFILNDSVAKESIKKDPFDLTFIHVNENSISGSTRLELTNPTTGQYIIKIKAQDAIGQVEINSYKTSKSNKTDKINLSEKLEVKN